MTESNQPPLRAATSAKRLAFTRAFEEYGHYFEVYFRQKTRDEHIAEDLSQELWLHVYEKFEPEQYTHVKLLQRKAEQIYIDYLRARGVRSFVEFTNDVPDKPVSDDAEPQTEAEEARFKARFWELFPGADLTDIQKEVYWMYARLEYTLQKISQITSVPDATLHDWIKKVERECRKHYVGSRK